MFTDVYCTSCSHAVFDEKWGEWKCGKSCSVIHNVCKASFCKYYSAKGKEKKRG